MLNLIGLYRKTCFFALCRVFAKPVTYAECHACKSCRLLNVHSVQLAELAMWIDCMLNPIIDSTHFLFHPLPLKNYLLFWHYSSMLDHTYYSRNYASIIGQGLKQNFRIPLVVICFHSCDFMPVDLWNIAEYCLCMPLETCRNQKLSLPAHQPMQHPLLTSKMEQVGAFFEIDLLSKMFKHFLFVTDFIRIIMACNEVNTMRNYVLDQMHRINWGIYNTFM